VDAKVVRVGKLSFASLDVSAELEEQVRELAKRGRTPVVVSEEGKVIGLIGIADAVKEGAKEAVEALKQAGLKVVMLTGDRREVALEVGADVGITEVIAEVLPGQKLDKVRELTMSGRKVMMVGDGINDAPALAGATVGVAMGSGADAARAAADLTLLRPDPRVLMEAIALSKDTIQVIRQNLFWAFAYNALGIPVAAGILYPFTGWLLSPMLASAAMAFSSLSVVLNSLRLARH
jgi:Cu+-exporting ATPase